jgi:hypothetical protein
MPYRIAGIDVHKKMLAVVVADVEVDAEFRFERQKVGTTPADLRRLADWLVEHEVDEVVMESTAQYWRPVWETLEQHWRPRRRARDGAPRLAGTLHLAQAQSNRGPGGRKKDFPDAERLLIPDRRKRVAEVSQQIRQHLTHGLRLPRELRQVMPIINRPLPEPLSRMQDARAVAADNGHGRGADAHDEIQSGPPTRHRVDRALEPYQRPRRHLANLVASAANGSGAARNRRCSSVERTPIIWPVASRCVSAARPSARPAPR